jgi:hypothetical protein
VVAALFLSGVATASATAATLAVTVKPTVVHRNQTYPITITGRYDMATLHTTPHLFAFIQYSSAACRPTATAEYALPVREWNWVFYPQQAEHRSPFKRVFYETARTRFGGRRVCAYLYPQQVTPKTTIKPIARAGAPYTEVAG